MDLKLSGNVKEILDIQSGEGKNGPWKKQDFILETPGKFPRLVCITQWGEQIDKNNIQVGEKLTAWVDIQSREYKGRWYTDVKAWKVEKGDSATGEAPEGGLPGDEKVIDFGAYDDEDPPF